jgi:lysophospholipase L1-like esterase
MFVAFFLGAVFGSQGLVDLAERQEVGARRDVALKTAEVLDRVANAFSLNRPYDYANAELNGVEEVIDIDDLLAGGAATQDTDTSDGVGADPNTPAEPGGVSVLGTQQDNTTVTTAAPVVDREGVARPAGGPDDTVVAANPGDGSPGATTQNPTTPTSTTDPPTQASPAARGPVTADEPLRLWVGGDSISRDLGDGMARVAPVDLVDPTFDPQFSSGLSRPDFFDWSQRLAQLVSAEPPDAVAIMFGANDYQNVEHEGRVLDRGTPEWNDLYRSRVGEAMDILGTSEGTTVTWVSLPIMAPGKYRDGAIELMNTIYAEESQRRPWVNYVDVYGLFADANGNYASVIGGNEMRTGDGVHMSRAGSDRLARAAWANVAARWSIS